MPKKKKGTLETVGEGVKNAAVAVAKTADEYIVQPVGNALGITTKQPLRPNRSRKKEMKKITKSKKPIGSQLSKKRAKTH
jgi:hypothetical protein